MKLTYPLVSEWNVKLRGVLQGQSTDCAQAQQHRSLAPYRLRGIVRVDQLTDWILTRPQCLCHVHIDNRDLRRIRSICFGQQSSAKQSNARRFKIVRGDRVKISADTRIIGVSGKPCGLGLCVVVLPTYGKPLDTAANSIPCVALKRSRNRL